MRRTSDAVRLRPLGMTRSGPVQGELFKDENRAAAHNLDGTVMSVRERRRIQRCRCGGVHRRRHRAMDAHAARRGQLRGSADAGESHRGTAVRGEHGRGAGGSLHDPNAVAGLGCDSYHFLRYRVIEKNGALNGVPPS